MYGNIKVVPDSKGQIKTLWGTTVRKNIHTMNIHDFVSNLPHTCAITDQFESYILAVGAFITLVETRIFLIQDITNTLF